MGIDPARKRRVPNRNRSGGVTVPTNMPTVPTLERLKTLSPGARVDRENMVLRGFVLAQKGPFKSVGRGEFDDISLALIVKQVNANALGVKSRFTHPDMSSDGLGKYLGRARDAYIDGDRVRGNLHFDPTAANTPNGNLSGYVMDLAESDPDALSSSLVLRVDQEYRLEPNGTRKKGPDGRELPPLWRPKSISASDIVDTGDAVDGLLSAGVDVDALPLSALWRGAEFLDGIFANADAETVRARVTGWLERYLSGRFGEGAAGVAAGGPVAREDKTGAMERLRRRVEMMHLTRPVETGDNG